MYIKNHICAVNKLNTAILLNNSLENNHTLDTDILETQLMKLNLTSYNYLESNNDVFTFRSVSEI